MREPTKAKVKDFWELCGFTLEEISSLKSDEPYFVLHEPDGEQWDYWIGSSWDTEIPVWKLYPPIDLNNLFEYAVPKLIKVLIANNKKLTIWGARKRVFELWIESNILEKDPALALFWACYKAMKGRDE